MRNALLEIGLCRVFATLLWCLVGGSYLLVQPSSVVAEDEPRRGVLADGRAFRTDENGNQLVDYIAELEVNVETLEKRIYGLEDDLKEKQALIERLQSGAAPEAVLQEKELVPHVVSQPSSPQRIEKAHDCQLAAAGAEEKATLERALRESRAQIQRIEDQLSAERAHREQQSEESTTRAHELATQLKQVREELLSERQNRAREVTSYENALRQVEVPSKISEQQIAILRKSVDEYKLQLASEQAARRSMEERSQKLLADKQSELDTLRFQQRQFAEQNQSALAKLNTAQQLALQQKQVELDKLQDRLTEIQVTQARAQQRQESAPRAALAEPSRVFGAGAPVQPSFSTAQPPSSLVGARERAVAELRSQVSSALAQLSMSVHTRDELFAHFDQRGRALQIRPSVLRATSGATPESIRNELVQASSVRDLLKLRDDVQFIALKVADDIAIVRRLSGRQR